ncbi:hypothetical protein [Streptomyces sp. H39-S7]|uniref:hypothetical protein n=1 Tax=Streptomyces sp. H39-S7 TaxID=3004357 RepID=UPI0022B04117|nr:hypothetical protein [Streptomyces sp. H39-S7]MCZ4124219.1 hypothetical protein [Streptomyces sp. H39-S7]
MRGTLSTHANDRLRAYVQAHGDRSWTPAELKELARLRDTYLTARRAERASAA